MSSASSCSARCSPGCIAFRAMVLLLVIVHHFDIHRAVRAIRPFEANPPLIVQSNTALALPIALPRFKPIARQIKILEGCSGVQLVQLHAPLVGYSIKGLDPLSFCEAARSLIAVAADHCRKRDFRYPLRQA